MSHLPTKRGKPFQSKLEPYSEFIRELRRKRQSYEEIRTALRVDHALTVSRSTIFSFVRVRSKRRKFYVMAESLGAEQPASANHTLDAIERLRRKPIPQPKKKIFEFDENKPLTLIKT